MDYFFYCRAKPQAGELWAQLTEAHWSFMDAYADAMIARGPTLNEDGTAATGSMHIVDLPNAEAARAFAFDEPNYRAGVYADVMIRRWQNMLGRTMWEFEGDLVANQRFLVIGHGAPDGVARSTALRDEHAAYFVDEGYLDRLIERGPLLSDDGSRWVGSAMLVEMPDRAGVEVMLAGDPFVTAGQYSELEIHRWEFGGRR
jgi:uncharacterized protein